MLHEPLPTVAILVAARNEEKKILDCLQALAGIDYPKDKLCIYIGDDHSEDGTSSVVSRFMESHPQVQLFTITESRHQLLGKANVLAQLARQTHSDIIFFTDADVRVGPLWVKGMMNRLGNGTDLVSGATAIVKQDWLSAMQNADWLYNLGLRYLLEKAGRPLAASGTNMAVSRPAYEAVGGFEKITRSIAEDFDLFRAIVRNGSGVKTVLDKNVLAFTDAAQGFGELIRQQRRWLTSTMRMPFHFLIGVFIQNLFPWLMLALTFIFRNPLFMGIFALKWIFESALLLYTYRKLGQRPGFEILFYPLYAGICNAIFLFSWILHPATEWKGRQFPGRQ